MNNDLNSLYKGTTLPKLNAKKNIELIKKYRSGDQKAYDELVKGNLLLVIRIVSNRFSNVECDAQDLVSIGTIGLIQAIDAYDETKNYTFSTFAGICITNEILVYLRKNNRQIKADSLSDFIDENESETTLLDMVKDETIDVQKDFEDKNVREVIMNAIKLLPPIEQEVIIQRYGLNGLSGRSCEAIAKDMNVTRQCINAKEKRALKRLKKILVYQGNIEIPEKDKISRARKR